MSTVRLFEVLSAIHPVSAAFQESLSKEVELLPLAKGHILLEGSRVADQIFFINSGFAMSYTYFEARKRIEAFWTTSDFIIPAVSFFERRPSQEVIQVAQSGEIICLSYSLVARLSQRFPEMNVFLRTILSRYYETCRQKIRDLNHKTAAARYRILLSTYPGIEQLVPQEQIASYLGITPQSLSRIKRSGMR